MKVICIDDRKWHSNSRCPVFGEVCTVEKSFISPVSETPVYSFYEYPTVPPHVLRCFAQKFFIPLSEIDETELVNVKEDVYA